jgi:flagellar biosynthesis chaperone FliJ
MTRATPTFRYTLEALLKQRRFEQDGSVAQERAARGALKAGIEKAQAAAAAVTGVETSLRESLKAGASIDPRRHESLSLYLVHARDVLRAKADQASKAEKAHEQTRSGLLRSVQVVRALERHKENKRREHKRGRQYLDQQKQDELWLARGPASRVGPARPKDNT